LEAGLPSSSSSSSCDLLTPQDILLLEWLEDVRLYEVQGYGAAINYQIAAPLLADVAAALVSAAAATSAGRLPLQLARLNFAHCETLTPLASLLGLFEPPEFEARLIPPLPADEELQAATADVSVTDIEADLEAADSITDDLVPIMMGSGGDAELPAGIDRQPQVSQIQQKQQPLAAKRRRLETAAAMDENTVHLLSSKLTGDAGSTAKHSVMEQLQEFGAVPHVDGSSLRSSSFSWSDDGLNNKASAVHQGSLPSPPEDWAPGFDPDDMDRVWRGGRVAPFGANLLVVLYGRTRPADVKYAGKVSGSSGGSAVGMDASRVEEHLVRLVYNEQVVPIPGCKGSGISGLECGLQEFLDVVVGSKADAHQYIKNCESGDLGGHHFIAAEGLFGSYSGSSSGSVSGSSSANGHGLELLTADGLSIVLPGG
jgi:hypothetical protein